MAKYDTGIFLCVGRRGTGKTTLLRSLVAELLSDGRHIALVFDPRGQFPGQMWQSVDQFRRAPKWLNRVNVFSRGTPAEVASLAVDLARRKMRVILVIDELDRACAGSMRYIDEKGWQSPGPSPLREIVMEGRHIGRPPNDNRPLYGVDLLGGVRRPTNVAADIGELALRIYIFNCNGRNTIDWLRETCTDEIADSAAKLPLYRHIDYDPSNVDDLKSA